MNKKLTVRPFDEHEYEDFGHCQYGGIQFPEKFYQSVHQTLCALAVGVENEKSMRF